MPLFTQANTSRPTSGKPSSRRAIGDSRRRAADCRERHGYTKRGSRKGDLGERETKILPPEGSREDVLGGRINQGDEGQGTKAGVS